MKINKILITFTIIAMLAAVIFVLEEKRTNDRSSDLYNFLCKAISWNQYWYELWDQEVLKDSGQYLMVSSIYSELDKETKYRIYDSTLNSIFEIIEENKNSGHFILMGVISRNNIEDYEGTIFDFYENVAAYKNSSIVKRKKGCDCKSDSHDLEFNQQKILLVNKLITEFFLNIGTVEDIPDKFVKELKSGKKILIQVGGFYNDYGDIFFNINNCQCIGIIIKNEKQQLIANAVYDVAEDKKYSNLAKKIESNGMWFIYKNEETSFIGETLKD